MTHPTSTFAEGARRAGRVLLATLLALAAAAAQAQPASPSGDRERPPRPRRWDRVDSWVYQLQHARLEELVASDADLLVIDYSRTGSDEEAWSRADVARMRASGKLVLAYLSIGEAEPYRYYWKEGWAPGKPGWILPPNPDWPDNFPVRFWEPTWQGILVERPGSYLDRILGAGFDGVYLDIVDGYERFESTRPSAAHDMIQLVRRIATHARTRAGADFGVFPQNALGLLEYPDYREMITGLGKEETYYFPENEPNPTEDRRWEENEMRKLVREGKLVLTVDYCDDPALRRWVIRRARSQGFVPYVTDVELDRIEPQPSP